MSTTRSRRRKNMHKRRSSSRAAATAAGSSCASDVGNGHARSSSRYQPEESDMAYVDGFVLAVQKDRLEEYKSKARIAGEIWKQYGAIDYVECVADDVPYGELTSFPRAV